MRSALRGSRAAQALAAVARSRELRRVQLAFAGFNAAEWAVWVAMLVYAYDQGGATTAGLVAVAQLLPAALVAPFAGVLADRYRRTTVLTAGYLAQAGAMGATGAVLLADGPPGLAYTLAAVAASAVTVTRPTQSALMPGLARTPDELTAANAVAGWVEAASVLAGPALAGVLLATGGAGSVFAVMAAVALGSALLVALLEGPPASARRGDEDAPSPLADVAQGFSVLRRHGDSRSLALLIGTGEVVLGVLDVLYVVLAVDMLDIGEGGAGYLNAAFGAGGVLAIAATAALIGRARLVPPLLIGIGVWSASLVAIGLAPSTLTAFLLLGAAGGARCLFDVAARTLLQRVAPPEVLARTFGFVESLAMAGGALGSALVPVLIAVGDAEFAFVGAAALLPLVVLIGLRRFLEMDRRADVPVVQLALLRRLPMMRALEPPALEGLARRLTPRDVAEGEDVTREGEQGHEFYVVADGELGVVANGTRAPTLTRGDGFGEIALLEDCPRTATVTALSPALLYSLERDEFLAAVSGDARFEHEVRGVADERLGRTGAVSGRVGARR